MKRSLLLFKTIFLFMVYYLMSSNCAEAQYKIFDFSKAASSGQTLYYKKVSGTTDEVYLCPPYSNSTYGSYAKPSGNVVVPATVNYGGHSYNVTGIYMNPFYSCPNVTSVTFPEGINYCNGIAVFEGCSSLVRINFPASMAFELSWYSCLKGCSSLIEVNYAAGNSRFKSVNGAVFSCDGDSLFLYPSAKNPGNSNFLYNISGSATGGLKYIGGIVWNNYLENVNIPNTVTTIGPGAFYGCSNLKRVVIGDGVKKVGAVAFNACSQIEEVVFGCSVDSIGAFIFRNTDQTQANTSLNTITMKPITPPAGVSQIVNFVHSTPVIVVPCNNFSAYSSLGANPNTCTVVGDYLYEYQMMSSSNGSVSVTQEPSCGNGCILRATAYPHSGKQFKRWQILYPDGTIDQSNTNANLSVEITSNFKITPMFENTVAAEGVNIEDVGIYAYDGKIHFSSVEGNHYASIYSIDGHCVYNGKIHNRYAFQVSSPGIYLVEIAGLGCKKIVVTN